MLINFLFKCFIVTHNYSELGVLIYNLKRFHIGEVEEGKLEIELRSPFQQVENRDISHFFVEDEIGTELWNIVLKVFLREHGMLLVAIADLHESGGVDLLVLLP